MDNKQLRSEIERTINSPGYKMIVEGLQTRKDEITKLFHEKISKDKYEKEYNEFHLMDIQIATINLMLDDVKLLIKDMEQRASLDGING